MVIVWGSRLFGKVDNVPGLFHVATKCGHCQFLPLIPMESVLVFDKQRDSYRGVTIPLSGKSILVAWMRAILVMLAFGAAIGAIIAMTDRRPNMVTGILLIIGALAAVGVFIWSYYVSGIGRATYTRAVKLAEVAKLSEEAMVLLEQHFGRVTPEEAARTLAELRAADEEMAELSRQQGPENATA
jgi:hypothetical protein